MAHGDLLYHDGLFFSAKKEDGTYDFHENFEYVTPWLKQADLAIGDFEGTINKDHYLAGYLLFNAPAEVMDAIKEAGYHVLDLAHNHILDSQIEGVISTADIIEKAGITPIGVYTHEPRVQAPLVIKEVNGIKVALLAYSYGFNGIEQYISQEDYNRYLLDLNEDKMKAEVERAEKEADITIIMPLMGVEYRLEPTEEQKALYHKMIDWERILSLEGILTLLNHLKRLKKMEIRNSLSIKWGTSFPINGLNLWEMKRMLSGLNVVFSWMSPSRRRMEKQLSEQLKLILLGSIEHQREPFHQKDIPCIITKLIFWKIL
ncbi:membrane protein (pseudogene) [Streptococcus pneumoniae]|nr:membrane protein (pseudogene) [Streptococcus pneumoniae]